MAAAQKGSYVIALRSTLNKSHSTMKLDFWFLQFSLAWLKRDLLAVVSLSMYKLYTCWVVRTSCRPALWSVPFQFHGSIALCYILNYLYYLYCQILYNTNLKCLFCPTSCTNFSSFLSQLDCVSGEPHFQFLLHLSSWWWWRHLRHWAAVCIAI